MAYAGWVGPPYAKTRVRKLRGQEAAYGLTHRTDAVTLRTGLGTPRGRASPAVRVLRAAGYGCAQRRPGNPGHKRRPLRRSGAGLFRIADRLSIRRRIVHQAVGLGDGPRWPGRGDTRQHDLVARRNVYERRRSAGLREHADGYA